MDAAPPGEETSSIAGPATASISSALAAMTTPPPPPPESPSTAPPPPPGDSQTYPAPAGVPINMNAPPTDEPHPPNQGCTIRFLEAFFIKVVFLQKICSYQCWSEIMQEICFVLEFLHDLWEYCGFEIQYKINCF